MKSLPKELGGTADSREAKPGETNPSDTLAALQALAYEGDPSGQSTRGETRSLVSLASADSTPTCSQRSPKVSGNKGTTSSSAKSSATPSASTRAHSTRSARISRLKSGEVSGETALPPTSNSVSRPRWRASFREGGKED